MLTTLASSWPLNPVRIILVIAAFLLAACPSEPEPGMTPVKVEIIAIDSGYHLLRGGSPYTVKGAGMAIDDIANFAARGGNSIRNWSTDADYQDTMALLDSAQKHGVTVSLGLALQAERHGFDYSDAAAVAAQLEWIRGEVEKYRDHPALLTWIIGNELNHSFTNPAVYDAVNAAAKLIKELDPNHLTTTTISEPDAELLRVIEERAPALDFLSIQVYGALFGLPDTLQQAGFDQPFMVTEWGTIGYWEMQKTAWGIPHETTSSEKAALISRGYHEVLSQFGDQLIGSYVFLWGQKQERTPTWFGLFTEAGEATEAVDVMQHAWTGSWPDNRSPQVTAIRLDGKNYDEDVTLAYGQTVTASFDITDPDGDALRYHWELKPESEATQAGGDREALVPNIPGKIDDPGQAKIRIMLEEAGNYRLFAYAYDDNGNAAHANIPFRVEPSLQQSKAALVAGEHRAVAYSGFRVGQHPDRGDGAKNPSDAEILEDLQILMAHEFRLIRLYDSGENSAATLQLIRQHELPIKVLLGAWLKAEISNHEGCAWLDEPIPESKLVANALDNAAELRRTIRLAHEYSDIVVAVNVGNEALVEWNDHMVTVDSAIAYIRQVKAAIEQPVTTADNYDWWIKSGARVAAEVDFIGVHTYPVWEDKRIDEAMSYTLENINGVHAAHPNKPIAVLEAGWATTSSEFGERANEADQARYFEELMAWARASNTTVFFFEAFDEPWKGNEYDPLGAEKHWGLWFVDRTPKQVVKE